MSKYNKQVSNKQLINIDEVINKLIEKNDIIKDNTYIKILGEYKSKFTLTKDNRDRTDKGKCYFINIPEKSIIDFKINKNLFKSLATESGKQYKSISFMLAGTWTKNIIACLETLYDGVNNLTSISKDSLYETVFKFEDDKSGVVCFPQYVNLKIKEVGYLDLPFTFRVKEKLKDEDYDSYSKVIDKITRLINDCPDNEYYLVPRCTILYNEYDDKTKKLTSKLATKFVLFILINDMENTKIEDNNIFVRTNTSDYLTPFQYIVRNDILNIEEDIKKKRELSEIDSFSLLKITNDNTLTKYSNMFNVPIEKIKRFRAGEKPTNRENWNEFLKKDSQIELLLKSSSSSKDINSNSNITQLNSNIVDNMLEEDSNNSNIIDLDE